MSEQIERALIDDLEITCDFFDNESVLMVFFGELQERRNDLLETLIEKGDDESRFKIQMIDEVIDLRETIGAELKTRRGQMV